MGMIGLGRMGANMSVRLMKAGHEIVAFDVSADSVKALAAQGAIAATSIEDMIAKLPAPRSIWMMIPTAYVDETIAKIAPHLSKGDTLIDGGNSYYKDDIRRAKELAKSGIDYVDVGTSGGVWGLDRGYCQMIGGPEASVKRLDPIFSALAPGKGSIPVTPARKNMPGTAEQGYLHCGPNGGGHFVKMVHNGIEYGIMAAYAEGLNIIKNADAGMHAREKNAETTPLREPEAYMYKFNLPDVAEVWRRGSVISSWLLDLTANSLAADPELTKFDGRVSDSGEGRWTIDAAIDEGVPAYVLTAALYARFASRGAALFGDKLCSAMRYEFGGHLEQTAPKGE
jgi:6-phosphogluconate dehydrogenase